MNSPRNGIGKTRKNLCRSCKGNELYKYVQPAFGLMPTNLPNGLAFQTPVWKNLDNAQRIFNRFGQLARIGKSIRLPTESELEALYEERKKAALILAKRGWFIPIGMTPESR